MQIWKESWAILSERPQGPDENTRHWLNSMHVGAVFSDSLGSTHPEIWFLWILLSYPQHLWFRLLFWPDPEYLIHILLNKLLVNIRPWSSLSSFLLPFQTSSTKISEHGHLIFVHTTLQPKESVSFSFTRSLNWHDHLGSCDQGS